MWQSAMYFNETNIFSCLKAKTTKINSPFFFLSRIVEQAILELLRKSHARNACLVSLCKWFLHAHLIAHLSIPKKKEWLLVIYNKAQKNKTDE